MELHTDSHRFHPATTEGIYYTQGGITVFLKIKEVTLVDDYLNSLIAFNEASLNNDQKTAKKHYKKMDLCFRTLRDSGQLSELIRYLNHENENVRLWVSTHLLPFDEKLAKDSLKKIVDNKKGLLSFSAEMTLQEWSKGNLTYLIE